MSDDGPTHAERIKMAANGFMISFDFCCPSSTLEEKQTKIVEALTYLACGHPAGLDAVLTQMREHPKRAEFEQGFAIAHAEMGALEARAKGQIS
jgi:hypothetical protein